MTNSWNDIANADLILIMGGNAAEAHPCGFKWVTEAMQKRKAKLIVVDPRFTRSAAVADVYAPIRVGTDIAFLAGVINHMMSNNKVHMEYVKAYTNASYLINPEFKFDNGFFAGYDEAKRTYTDRSTWQYVKDKKGEFVEVDETLEAPNCVWQLMKKHYSRYTPEMVNKICGTPKDAFLKIADMIAGTSTPDRVMTILYALGWTQHSVGSQNIRAMAMIQLLLGNMGRAGGGVNALRGHANVQGITDMCAYSEVMPGYLGAPTDGDDTHEKYLTARTPKPLRPGSMNFPQNFPKWSVSQRKAWFGDAANKDNDFAYDWLPKRDGAYDVLAMFDRMFQGKMNGFICQGFNPIAAVPNKKKLGTALSKLKYLVIMDPLQTETADFWKDYGEFNKVDSSTIQTEVFRLPASCFAEDPGSFTNSSRQVQWHGRAVEPPGEARTDREIMASLFLKLREMYAKEGGAFPDAIKALTWNYSNPSNPAPEEVLREINGRAIADVMSPPNPKDPKAAPTVLVKAGDQLPGFGLLRDDGSTACGNWIYSGVWTQAGNNSARRDTADPSGWASIRTGASPGRPTGEFSITVQAHHPRASRGIPSGGASPGMVPPGQAWTCRTSRQR
jgi:formate dehydrogenase-N alpha subunit